MLCKCGHIPVKNGTKRISFFDWNEHENKIDEKYHLLQRYVCKTCKHIYYEKNNLINQKMTERCFKNIAQQANIIGCNKTANLCGFDYRTIKNIQKTHNEELMNNFKKHDVLITQVFKKEIFTRIENKNEYLLFEENEESVLEFIQKNKRYIYVDIYIYKKYVDYAEKFKLHPLTMHGYLERNKNYLFDKLSIYFNDNEKRNFDRLVNENFDFYDKNNYSEKISKFIDSYQLYKKIWFSNDKESITNEFLFWQTSLSSVCKEVFEKVIKTTEISIDILENKLNYPLFNL